MVALIAILILSVYSNMHELAIIMSTAEPDAPPPPAAPRNPQPSPTKRGTLEHQRPTKPGGYQLQTPNEPQAEKTHPDPQYYFYQLTHILMLKLMSSVLSYLRLSRKLREILLIIYK